MGCLNVSTECEIKKATLYARVHAQKRLLENSDPYRDMNTEQLRSLLMDIEVKNFTWQAYMSDLVGDESFLIHPEKVYEKLFNSIHS